MNLSLFYSECQSLPENERRWVDAFYKTVVDTFGEQDQSFSDLHKVCSLFYGNHSSKLCKAQYYRKRKLVLELYTWLAKKNEVSDDFLEQVRNLKLQDVVSNAELYLHYFKDLDAALNFITKVGMTKGLGDYDDLLPIKAITILTWHQVATSELLDMKKSDLKIQDNAVAIGDRVIQLDEKYFNILRRFSELDVHKGFPSQKMQVYVSSNFLMRSSKRINLCQNTLQKTLERFNTVAVEHGKELSLVSLRRNGVFSQAYASASDDKTSNSIIQEILGCDTAFAYGYKELYERWKLAIAGGDEN